MIRQGLNLDLENGFSNLILKSSNLNQLDSFFQIF